MFRSDLAEQLAAIAAAHPGHFMEKFFAGVDGWIGDARSRCRRLGLAGVTTQRVFDVGCGVPYFLAAARELGHQADGLDVPDQALEAAARAMGFVYLPHTIWEPEELPAIGGPFDLVTMFGVNLRHRDLSWWDWADWTALVAWLLHATAPGGRVVIQPNRGPHCSELLMDELRWRSEHLPATVRVEDLWIVFEK